MKKKSVFVLLLCLFLLISTGCEQNTPPETTIPTTKPVETQPPETTVPPDPLEDYNKAFEALGTDAVKMSVELSKTVTVAGQVFTTESDLFMDYWNIGTPEFTARVKETADLRQHLYMIDEVYTGGNVYQTIIDGHYFSEMTPEDFVARYPDITFLDPALYTLSYDATGILLSDATGLEEWLGGEEAELIKAEGHKCDNGRKYVEQELTDPKRTIASSILVQGGDRPLVSVRLTAPVEPGTVVLPHVFGTDADLITTSRVKKK